MSKAKVIGIGGVSQSGKSSLAKKLEHRFPGKTLLISQDSLTNLEIEIPKIQDRTDWEHPDSLDFSQMKTRIIDSKEEFDLIILEGLMAFYQKGLRDLFDLTIKLTISKETYLLRRKQETRWGSEPDWFLEHVWDSFLKFGNYQYTELQLSGENQISNKDVDMILRKLNLI